MTDRTLLAIGAHPDDADIKAGGLAAKYADRGDDVVFVSATNGDAGHHRMSRDDLAARRREEASAAASAIGIEYRILDNRDGYLEPSLERRERFIRLIRSIDPDVIVTHRPNDYHPDHRATAALVRDAAYLVTVPNVCPKEPPLDRQPVVAYLSDGFEKPAPFDPDVVVAVDDVVDRKIEMLHQHESQVYEWLPYNSGALEAVPDDEDDRREWLREARLPAFDTVRMNVADEYRDRLIDRYGADLGSDVEHAEAFEVSEYGRAIPDAGVPDLFPR